VVPYLTQNLHWRVQKVGKLCSLGSFAAVR
jgi:hypothetical protein